MLRCTSCLASVPSWASRGLYHTHTRTTSTALQWQSTSIHCEAAPEQEKKSAPVTRPIHQDGIFTPNIISNSSSTSHSDEGTPKKYYTAASTATPQVDLRPPKHEELPKIEAKALPPRDFIRWNPITKQITTNRLTPAPAPDPGSVRKPQDANNDPTADTLSPSRQLEASPTLVHITDLPANTTKTEIIRAITALGPIGRIMGLILSDTSSPHHPGRVHASIEYDSHREASELLARVRDGALTICGDNVDDASVRLEIRQQKGPVGVGLYGEDHPTRVLRIKVALREGAIASAAAEAAGLRDVESILRFLREKGVDDEMEAAYEVKRQREGGVIMIYLRFCCWRYQAGPAFALLRGQKGLGVWYSQDPCEGGERRLSDPWGQRVEDMERSRASRSGVGDMDHKVGRSTATF